MNQWEQYEQLVRWVTWKVIKRYGGDYDELFSEALVAFTEATQSYDPNLGSLSNWIHIKCYKALQELRRTEARRNSITGPFVSLDEIKTIYSSKSVFEDLWSILSDEAQTVLDLLFHLDCSQYKNKSFAKLSVRSTLMRKGWHKEEINQCFKEIEQALDCT